MELMPIFEVVRIKPVIREMEEPFAAFTIRSPEDAKELAEAHIGSLNASIVHPRDVMKSAILNNAASIIVSHQHPSGNPTPSKEDIEVTKRLAEAGKIIGIELLDHVIVSHTGKHISLKEKGYL